MPGNADAWTLWKNVNTQWRAGGVGIIGLDYRAVRDVSRWLGLDFSVGLLRKIQALERYELERINSGNDDGNDPEGFKRSGRKR